MSGTWQSLKKQTCGLFSIVAFAYMASLDFSPSMEQVSTAMVIYVWQPCTAVWDEVSSVHRLCKAELCPRLAPCLKGEHRAL